MSAFRPHSPLDRLQKAFRQERSISPIDLARFLGGWGMPAQFKPQDSLRAYGDNVWLYRSVLSIAMEIASIDFKMRRMTKDGEFEYVLKHQALETLRLPQPTKGGKSLLTGMLLKIITGMHLMLNGEAFWLLENRRSKTFGAAPTFIKPLLAQHMFMKLSDDGTVMEYTYRTGSREQTFDPMDIVHFRLPDPENYIRGHSPVQGIRYAVDTHKKADIMNTKKLDNFAAPAGVLMTDQAIPEEERRKILSQWEQRYGGIDNAGKTAMLPKGLKFEKTQESNQEMQFMEGKNLTRDEILAAYGVGLEIFGKTESQTRSNAEASIFVFERFGVLPYVRLINDTLNNDYAVAFPGTEGLEFCFDDPVPENQEEKRMTAENLSNRGALTPNEHRKMFGLEPLKLPGMDVPYVPIGVMPIDSPPIDPLADPNTNNDY